MSWLSRLFKRRAQKEHSTVADSWLYSSTKRDMCDWVRFIQGRIVAHSSPSDDPSHDQTDSAAWVQDVIQEVMDCWPKGHEMWPAKDPRQFDGNMRMARELGIILCAWYGSVHRAKTRDPDRPFELRRMAHKSRERWVAALVSAVTDDMHDPEAFPGQEFEHPFSPDATDGDFV